MPRVSDESVKGWLDTRPGWKHEGGTLVEEFHFSSFRHAIVFVNRLASIADASNRHPDTDTVRVTLNGHGAKDIAAEDLGVAERIDFATAIR